MKVRDLVHASARIIGIVAQGENMTDAELNDAISALNMMLGQWSSSQDYVYFSQDIVIPLNGDEYYEFEAKLISTDAKLGDEQIRLYRDIARNTPKNSITYYKTPTGYVLKVPAKVHGELIIQSLISPEYPLRAFDDVVIPDEYLNALKYSLVMQLAPEYPDLVLSDVAVQNYQQAMRIMHRAQSTPTPIKPDQVLMGISRGCHWRDYD